MNHYTHLRTLLDDESRHDELCSKLQSTMFGPRDFNFMVHDITIWESFMPMAREHFPYTTSLDALLTLWPEGWGWSLSSNNECVACRMLMSGDILPDHDVFVSGSTYKTPVLAMLDCLLQTLEYEWGNKK
jgi:hypothetical protein